jgi:streptogramin lyase
MMDNQDHLWFGENRSDKIGMFDTKSQTFKEWAPKPGAWPYDVTVDKNGEAGREANTTTAFSASIRRRTPSPNI